MKALSTLAIFTSFRSKVDRSLGFSGVTPELSTDERALFMDIQGKNVGLLIEPIDEPSELYKVEKQLQQKTPSQRLRATLYVYWKQEGIKDNFEDFYNMKMEKYIDEIKDLLY